jgi:hypothetical protein
MVDNEQKIIEHERMREEGRHEDEIPMPGTVITAQELQPDAQDAQDAHDDSDHVDADADAESDSQEHGADDDQHQPDEEAE